MVAAFGNVGLSYDPKEWVSLRLTVGADYVSDQRLETLPKTSSSFPTGQVVRGNLVNYQLDNNLTATFTQVVHEGFESRFVVGGNLNSRNFRQDLVTGQDLIAPQPFVLTNTTTRTPNDFRSLIRGESYFGQYQQEFWKQLYLTGNAPERRLLDVRREQPTALVPGSDRGVEFHELHDVRRPAQPGPSARGVRPDGHGAGRVPHERLLLVGVLHEHVRRRAARDRERSRRTLYRGAQAAGQPQAGASDASSRRASTSDS